MFKRKQKFLNFYGQILNLRNHVIGNTASIFLICTVNCVLPKALNKCMALVLKQIETINKSKNYELRIAYFSGDTPISQSIGGFVSSVGSANYFCRRCMAQKNNPLRRMPPRNLRQLRSLSNNSKSSNMGVVEKTPAQNCTNFNAIIQTPFDLMHILLEGVCRKLIHRVMHEIVKKRAPLSLLNNKIQNFKYKFNHKKSKLSIITDYDLKKDSLITTSAQMLTLFKLLPYIFEDILDFDHISFKYLLKNLK